MDLAVHESYKQLDDMLSVVKSSSHKDEGNVLEGIQLCSSMLKEMKSSSLSPKAYYELCVVYIKAGESSKKEILRDLVEMCRGVQNPLRGLFLRSYLLHSIDSNLLSSSIEKSEPREEKMVDDCTLYDSIDFILLNFSEMNKLWVRMQHQGHSREKERREQERKDLKLLVGTNLDRLSRLEGVDAKIYETQICECNDVIAQEYLLDVVIQVFSDEFHLTTLHKLIEACRGLAPAVRIRPILCSLIERLCQYFLTESKSNNTPKIPEQVAWPPLPSVSEEGANMMKTVLDVPTKGNLFHLLATEIANMLLRIIHKQLERGGLIPNDIPLIYHALMYVAMHLHKDKAHPLINYCLKCTTLFLKHVGVTSVTPQANLANEILCILNLPMDGGLTCKPNAEKQAFSSNLSRVPVESLCSIRDILNMDGFSDLVKLSDAKTAKRRLACHILLSALERNHMEESADKEQLELQQIKFDSRLTTMSDLDGLLNLIDVLVIPEDQKMLTSIDDADELAEEHCLIAGVLHLIGPDPRSNDCLTTFELLEKFSKVLAKGDEMLVRNTFPALIFEIMQLLRAFTDVKDTLNDWDNTVERVIKFCHSCISKLIKFNAQETALRLFLETALIIDKIPFNKRNSLVYEFLSQAFVLGEDGLPDFKSQLVSLLSVISCLLRMENLDEENHATLRKHCYRAATHLLRKPDQAKAVASTAHLYWSGTPLPKDGKFGDKPVPLKNHAEVMQYFDRTCQLTDECMDPALRVQLSVDLLNYCTQFRLMGCEQVTDDFIKQLLDKIKSGLSELGNVNVRSVFITYFRNTLNFLIEKQNEDKLFSTVNFDLSDE